MVEQYFPALWEGREARLRGKMEITRFCAAPSLLPHCRLAAVSDLLLGLCRYCQRAGVQSFFGVVFPAMTRVVKQAGWPPVILHEPRETTRILQLVEWTATERVAWDIQERREFREELWRQRRAGTQELGRLVA